MRRIGTSAVHRDGRRSATDDAYLRPLLQRRAGQSHPLRFVARRLEQALPRSTACTHLRGHGGLKGAIRRVRSALPEHGYVCRTDIKSFYASIDHFILLDQLDPYVRNRDVMRTLVQYMRRTVEYGGTLRDITRGIPAGCLMNRQIEKLGLTLHPDKTSIGPIARGFDFLGYRFDPDGLSLSQVTRQRHQEKLTRLYERYLRQLRATRKGWIGQSPIPRGQDPARAYLYPRPQIKTYDDITQLLEAYERRFTAWAQGGLNGCLHS